MSKKFNYRLGIDPAWKNLGISLVREDTETGEVSLVDSAVMNPSTYKSIPEYVHDAHTWIYDTLRRDVESMGHEYGSINLSSAVIERFVAYAGVSTAETENICMIIGGLQQMVYDQWGTLSHMVRAIDWKTALVKALHILKGFENPSAKLDKKFSIAAAVACLDESHKFKTDHEADATCLASLPVMLDKAKAKRKK